MILLLTYVEVGFIVNDSSEYICWHMWSGMIKILCEYQQDGSGWPAVPMPIKPTIVRNLRAWDCLALSLFTTYINHDKAHTKHEAASYNDIAMCSLWFLFM